MRGGAKGQTMRIPKLPPEQKAFQQGRQAKVDSSMETNPYERGTYLWRWWNKGWNSCYDPQWNKLAEGRPVAID